MPVTSSRAYSPPQSVVSSGQGSPSPVHVKKVVVDGRSRAEGATLRMYLKLSVAIDNAQPGTSIPLFPEDNVRIITSEVQPLDDRSVPYYFSATEQPLLQKTAIALQLGPKSSRPYQSLFPDHGNPADPNVANTSRRHRENNVSSLLDIQRYTGRIVVSGYNVALVLPKEFPPKTRSNAANADSDGDDGHVKEVPSSWSTRSARRPSIFNKNYLHLMVGIELFLPYVLTPPRGPFLISIPVPRCLDNHLKMRIVIPPSNAPPRSLIDSASSGDDSPGWDFLTDPPVSRKMDKSSRRSTYNQVDDEQSDAISAPSTPGTEVIQGAFQSTDFLHIRWAPPLGRKSGAPKTEDGMRRVSIQSTQGRMKCHILGRNQQSICMGVIYEGTCIGLWHPGVATILGMDVALDVKGRRVTWSDEDVSGWAVTGEEGFGGLYSEAPLSVSRKTSLESNFSSTWLPTLTSDPVIIPARGSASLLRAPLPVQNTPDYSFETSPNGTGTPSTPADTFSRSVNEDVRMSRGDVAPGKVITLKINLMKLLPPAKNELNFAIRGVIIIDVEQEDFFPLPEFRVLGSHPQDVKTWVSSRTGDAAFYLGEQSGKAPKHRLRAGEEVRCEDAVGLFIGSPNVAVPPPSPPVAAVATSPALRRMPSRNLVRRRRRSNAEATSEETENSPQLPMLQQLPYVLNTVTPLSGRAGTAHCVRVNIPMYSLDADTIQFGLAVASSSAVERTTTTIDVLYASYAGRQVYVEVVARDSPLPLRSRTTSVEDSQVVGEIHSLLVVHFEDVEADTGEIEVVYVVTEDAKELHDVKEGKRKRKETEKGTTMDVLLPCFDLPVARYEVNIERPPNLVPCIEHSTLPHRHVTETNSQRLMHFRLPPGFFPTLCLSLSCSSRDIQTPTVSKTRKVAGLITNTIIFITFITMLFLIVTISSEIREIRHTMHATAQAIMNGVPYLETYWGYDRPPPWAQERIISTVATVTTTATHTTTVQTENVVTDTPTIILADATPVPERRTSYREKVDQARALIPAIPLISSKFPISTEARDFIVKSLMKAWHLIRKAWNFPMDPD